MASESSEMIEVMEGATDSESLGEDLESLYRQQVLARTLDERAVNLNRQGRIGTYAPLRGHEAIQVGAMAAITDRDWVFPTYRDHAMWLARGFAVADVLYYLTGQGNFVEAATETVRTFPPTIPVGTQLEHAVGAAMAATYDDSDAIALASFGEGATSTGEFHEAMNFAGVYQAPVVFLCQNNQYAISVPVERQSGSETIAIKADAYGFNGVRVDGTDVLAVNRAIEDAVADARAGAGPTLIEAVTYRQGPHTTADDPSRYRPDSESDHWPDPIERSRAHLRKHCGWTEEEESQVRDWAAAQVEAGITAAERRDDPTMERVFDTVFADATKRLTRQRSDIPPDPDSLH